MKILIVECDDEFVFQNDSNHVLLDETNLETDAPESIEYIVVTEDEDEEDASILLQQGSLLLISNFLLIAWEW